MNTKRRDFFKTGAAAAFAMQAPAALSAQLQTPAQTQPQAGEDLIVPPPASPFDVGTRAQLFADQVLVHDTQGVTFRQHLAEKHPLNPIVKVDKEWEGWRVVLYGDVIYDEQDRVFKMWYCAEAPGYFNTGDEVSPVVTLYATSTDGVHWDKPLVGTIPSTKNIRHNAVADAELASITKDLSDPDPSRRYKMISFKIRPREQRGYHTHVSPDGLNWRLYSKQPICPGSDVITGYFDERLGCYVALAKIGTVVRGHRRRVFHLITSKDFVNWTKPRLVWTPDLRDDAGSLRRISEVRSLLSVPDDPKLMRTEFYGFGFYPTESCTFAFPWMFTINNNVRYGNQEGPGELQMGVSRDMVNWHRPFRTPIVPRGGLTEWDRGFFCTQARALRVRDEVWLYYCGSTYTHGADAIYRKDDPDRGTKQTAGIGIAKWKLDRFVSAGGTAADASLTTMLVVMQGDRLELNANVHAGGTLRVKILDEAGKPLNLPVSDPVRGDHLRHQVRWKTGSIAELRGRPISLRFELKGAELFSFAFRQGA